MFEMRNEPPPNQYMRHQAWLIQRYYLKRCRAVRDTLEHEPVFALSSALGLMGIAPPETAVLDLGKEHIVVRNRDARRGHPANVACHAWSLLDDRIVIRIFDLYCTSPAATFAQFVRFNWFEETIILADRLTCRDERLRRATKQELMDFLDERKVYGGKAARRALRLSRPNTDSRWERELRLDAMKWGLPNPEANHPVDLGSGLAWLDMAYEKYRVAMEFHGQQHLEQYVADTRRMNALAAKNWVVLPAWQSTVLDQAELHRYFSQVAAALEHAGAVDFLHPRMDLWTLSGNHGEPEIITAQCDTKGKGTDYFVLPVLQKYGEDYYCIDCVCDNTADYEEQYRNAAGVLVNNKVQECEFERNAGGDRVAMEVNKRVEIGRASCRERV